MAQYEEVEDPRLHYLKGFQSKRLAVTYKDFTEKKEYTAATFFFFNRLYSTEDTADRDASFRKIHKLVHRYLGGDVVKSMDKLIELQELTIALDNRMLELMIDQDLPVAFDMETYERIYREADNYDPRIRQIELLEFVNRLIHKISHRWGIGLVLEGLRGAAMIAGDTRMVDFLMDGYKAFKHMRKIDPLVDALGNRERRRLDRIYLRDPDSPW